MPRREQRLTFARVRAYSLDIWSGIAHSLAYALAAT
jgi:hypothetical protein